MWLQVIRSKRNFSKNKRWRRVVEYTIQWLTLKMMTERSLYNPPSTIYTISVSKYIFLQKMLCKTFKLYNSKSNLTYCHFSTQFFFLQEPNIVSIHTTITLIFSQLQLQLQLQWISKKLWRDNTSFIFAKNSHMPEITIILCQTQLEEIWSLACNQITISLEKQLHFHNQARNKDNDTTLF